MWSLVPAEPHGSSCLSAARQASSSVRALSRPAIYQSRPRDVCRASGEPAGLRHREMHCCGQQPQSLPEIQLNQAAAAIFASGLLCLSGQAHAFDFPNLPGGPPLPPSTFEERAKAFEESDFLRGLKEKTTTNKARNKKELEDKYCYRQAELGVGDCAGLRLIPGATKSGKQQTPEWLANILGKGKQAAKEAEDDIPLAGAE